jgi:hypothetical protein
MLRSLSLALLLSAALGSPFAQAAAIQYDFTFTGQGLLPSGSFTYDDTVPLFTSFVITWNGTVFDLTSQANNPYVKGPPPPACLNGATGAAAAFIMISNGCPANETSWNAYEDIGLQAFSLQFDADDDVNGIYVERNIYGNGQAPPNRALGDWTISRSFDVDIDPVPEPSTFITVALAGLAVLGKSRKR